MSMVEEYPISKLILIRLGEEAADYIYLNSHKWVEMWEYDYEIDLDIIEIIEASAQKLLASNEIDQALFDEVTADCSWTAELYPLRQHLLDALDELIGEIEYEMEGECTLGYSASHFLP